MTRKALGKGLSALLGEREEREELLEIDLDLIKPNSEQPRVRFGQKELEELAQSIKENGVVQPVVVRRVGNDYELVAGERRWKAAQMAGLTKIPAFVKEVSDEKMLELALVENIQRQELNPIEEARAYEKLVKKFSLTQEEIAKRVGKDRTAIATHLRLLKLPQKIQVLIEEGKLTVGHAKVVLMLDDEELRWETARRIVEKGLSVREAEKLVKGLSKKQEKKEKFRKIDANLKVAEEKLKHHLGTQVRIVPNRNGEGGRIEIEYYSLSDLDTLYQRLIKS